MGESSIPGCGPSPEALGKAGQRALVLASFDSFLKATRAIGDALIAAGWQVDYRLLKVRAGQLSRRQLHDLGFSEPLPAATMAEIACDPSLFGYDVIVLGLDGRRTRGLLATLRLCPLSGRSKRPLTIALYPGVVFRHQTHGVANRFGADLILFNSPADQAFYQATCRALGIAADRGLCFGSTVIHRTLCAGEGPIWPPRTIVYAEQPDVPATRTERLYLIDRLIEYARRHPDRRLYIKPRHAPGETALRATTHHLESIVRQAGRLGVLPANLQLGYEPIERLLDHADLCLTVSSTVALQAAARGIPFAILGDFGICEDNGTHFFLGSGCITTFDAVLQDRRPLPRPEWLDQHVMPAEPNMPELLREIEARLEAQHHAQLALGWPADPFAELTAAFQRYKAADGAKTTGLPLRARCRVSPVWARKVKKLLREPRRFFADMLMNLEARLLAAWRRERAPAPIPTRSCQVASR